MLCAEQTDALIVNRKRTKHGVLKRHRIVSVQSLSRTSHSLLAVVSYPDVIKVQHTCSGSSNPKFTFDFSDREAWHFSLNYEARNPSIALKMIDILSGE